MDHSEAGGPIEQGCILIVGFQDQFSFDPALQMIAPHGETQIDSCLRHPGTG